MDQMKIAINEDFCNRCGHCSDFFKGLPDWAFYYILIPHWIVQDQDIMDDLRRMIDHCESGAISLVACAVY